MRNAQNVHVRITPTEQEEEWPHLWQTLLGVKKNFFLKIHSPLMAGSLVRLHVSASLADGAV